MPYDRSLDKCLFTKSCDTDLGRLTVSIYSYNEGPKKMQIVRENKDGDGNLRFTRLGRISKEEAESVLPLIQEAMGAFK